MERYELGREAAQQIALLVKQELMRALPQMMAKQQASNAAPMIYLAKSGATGIEAMTGDTPGFGNVTLQMIEGDEVTDYLDGTGNTVSVTAYNVSDSSVQADTIIQLKQELCTGKLLVDFENCPPIT